MTVLRQRVQHTTTAIHPAVAARQRGGQDHEVDNPGRSGNSNFGKRENERAAVAANLIPREDSDDHKYRADVENQDTPQHFPYRATQCDLRIFGFTRRDADQLHPLVGGHHDT
ncbi:hypothetical protein D3C81_1446420 [compost metagenome]